jgi:hypothetical protein
MKPQSKVDNPIRREGMLGLFDAISSKDTTALKAFGDDKKTDWTCTYRDKNVFHHAAVTHKKSFKTLLKVVPHDKKILLLKQPNPEGKTPLDLLVQHGAPATLIEDVRKTLGEKAPIRDCHTIDPCEKKTSHAPMPKVSTDLLPAPHLFQPKSIPCNPKSPSYSLVHESFHDGSYIINIPFEEIELGHKLGEGQFGEIYYGHWNGKEVAMKQSKSHFIYTTISAYKKEASLMASLNSSYIVTLIGVCHSPKSYSLVLEYISEDLTKVLLGSEMLPWSERRNIASDVAKGLAVLHNRKPMIIIHRDIKSHNILLTKDKHAKLADFGLAIEVPVESSSSKYHMYSDSKIVGALGWMAPECFNGQYSTKSDIYAFGMVLWEIVSRKRPYDDIENTEELFEAVRHGKREEIPDQMSQLESGNPTAKTPQSIKDFIRCCWFHDPAKRPSADDAVKAFNEDIKKELEENNPVQLGNAI